LLLFLITSKHHLTINHISGAKLERFYDIVFFGVDAGPGATVGADHVVTVGQRLVVEGVLGIAGCSVMAQTDADPVVGVFGDSETELFWAQVRLNGF
jgi:hypothetical protein